MGTGQASLLTKAVPEEDKLDDPAGLRRLHVKVPGKGRPPCGPSADGEGAQLVAACSPVDADMATVYASASSQR